MQVKLDVDARGRKPEEMGQPDSAISQFNLQKVKVGAKTGGQSRIAALKVYYDRRISSVSCRIWGWICISWEILLMFAAESCSQRHPIAYKNHPCLSAYN